MLTAKQKEFCKQVANGKNATEAYQLAFGAKSTGTCKVNGSKLLKQAAIAEKIREFQDQNKRITERAIDKSATALAEGEFADVAERKQTLTKILRGEIKVPNTKFFFDGKTGQVVSQEVEELPDHATRIKAISELNKMDGDYAPIKQDLHLTGTKISVKLNK